MTPKSRRPRGRISARSDEKRRSAQESNEVGHAAARPESSEDVWQIERIIPGGDGMARLAGGLVGFVSGALPGERVLVTATQKKQRFLRARAFRVLEAAAERVPPACVYAGACGGCDWLHVEYGAQLRHKLDILRDALVRVGSLEDLPELTIEPSPSIRGYRNRIRVHLGRGKIGFLAHQSHELVDVETCLVAEPELDRALARFRATVHAHPEAFELISEAELRVAPDSAPALVRLSPRTPGAGRERYGSLVRALERDFRVALAGIPSATAQSFPLGPGLELRVPPDAFVQINWSVNLRIVSAVVAEAEARKLGSFVDLYAGAGNFTLPLLSTGRSGVAVEGEGEAAKALSRAIAERGLRGEVRTGDVAREVRRMTGERQRFDLVILDPPRAGAADVAPLLSKLGPAAIAYCACDPVTLARDLKLLRGGGFRLDGVVAYDMFPGTHHFETVAWLSG